MIGMKKSLVYLSLHSLHSVIFTLLVIALIIGQYQLNLTTLFFCTTHSCLLKEREQPPIASPSHSTIPITTIQSQQQFQENNPLTTVLAQVSEEEGEAEAEGEEEWIFLGTFNNVKTYNKKIPGSKLLAFRGVILLDVHISHALGPFINVTQSLEWVSMLKSIVAYPLLPTQQTEPERQQKVRGVKRRKRRQENKYLENLGEKDNIEVDDSHHDSDYIADDILYQVLSLPWPISSRDILLKREFQFEFSHREVTINYHSIEDERVPITSDYIRAISPHTMWRFTGLNHSEYLTNYDGSVQQRRSYQHRNPDSLPNLPRESSEISSPTISLPTNIVSWKHQNSLKLFFTSLKQKVSSFWKGFTIFTLRSLEKLTPLKIKKKAKGTSFLPVATNQNSTLSSCSHQTRFTLVEVETIVDSKGSIPAWFINYMQR